MGEQDPISYLALEAGTPVKSATGTTFGAVEHVLQIPEEDLFDGIVVTTDRGLRFVHRPSRSHVPAGALDRGAQLSLLATWPGEFTHDFALCHVLVSLR